MIEYLGPWCFLECHCLLSTFKTSSGVIQKEWPSGTVSAPAYAVVGMLTSAGPTVRGSSATLTANTGKCVMEAARGTVETLVARVTSAHTHAPLDHRTSLRKHGFKDKITTHLKTAIAEHETKR